MEKTEFFAFPAVFTAVEGKEKACNFVVALIIDSFTEKYQKRVLFLFLWGVGLCWGCMGFLLLFWGFVSLFSYLLPFSFSPTKVHTFIHIQTVSQLLGKIRETFPNSVRLS